MFLHNTPKFSLEKIKTALDIIKTPLEKTK